MNELHAVIEKTKKNMREYDELTKKHESGLPSYSSEQLKTLAEHGYIPKELVEWQLKYVGEKLRKNQEMKEFKKNNPDMSEEEVLKHFFKEGPLSPEETAKFYEDASKEAELFKLLFENKELLQPGALDDLPSKFFRSLQTGEFGIARLVSDPLNHVPNLLKTSNPPKLIQEDIYLLKWECDNSTGDKIRLEHRFRANNQSEADRQALEFVKRLTGRQKKVYEACWAMANQKMHRTYTCQLTELMEIAYPTRKDGTPFSVKERVEFYQDLLDLSETQFIISKKQQKKKKKDSIESFILPFITILKYTEDTNNKESEKYPNQISLSVLHNPLYESEILYNVGAGIKYKTLELHSDDMQLAEWIQIRKSQAIEQKYIEIDRPFMIQLANLGGIKHKGMANKRLKEKLERLKQKGIILGYPRKIIDDVKAKLKIR